MRLSIVLPCYNEEENIERTTGDVVAWLETTGIDGEMVAVDDGSSDRTRQILERLSREYTRLRVVTHDRNLGYGAAVRAGLDASSGEWLAFMDSDGQFEVGDFEQLLLKTGETDVITGRRIERADPLSRRLNAWCFGVLNRVLFGVRVKDINCAMKMIHCRVWPWIRPRVTTGALFNLELFARMKRHGVAWSQVSVRHYPRRAGDQTGAKLRVISKALQEMLQLIWNLRIQARRPPSRTSIRRHRQTARRNALIS